MAHETYRIQVSISINKRSFIGRQPHLFIYIVYGCFHTAAERSSCDIVCRAHKTEGIYYMPDLWDY